MNSSAVYSKSGKGVQEATGKTSHLKRPERAVLAAVDGRSTVAEVAQKVGKPFDAAFEQLITNLDKQGYIREISASGPQSTVKPGAPVAPADVEDLDFTQKVSVPPRPSGPKGKAVDLAAKARAEAQRRAQEEAVTSYRARQEADARAKAQAEAKERAEREVRLRAEADRSRAEAEAKARADADAKTRAESDAKMRAAQEAIARAAAEAEERARKQAEEQDRKEAEARARKEAEEKDRKEAEERARKKAEEKSRKEAEERARKEAEEKARKEAEEKARKEAEERARKEAEEKARKEAEERAKKEAEEKARKEAEERARKEAEEKARKEAEERARKEAEQKARKEAEERARKEAEERARKEAEENARREAEERARREQEERRVAEEAERVRREAEEWAQRAEAERKRQEEEAERFRKQAEERARREDEERQRRAEEERLAIEEAKRVRKEAEEQARRDEEERRRREEREREAKQAPAAAADSTDDLLADFDTFAQRDAERVAKEEAERKARREAARQEAQEEAERKRQEAAVAAEALAKREAEDQRRMEEERRAREENEARRRQADLDLDAKRRDEERLAEQAARRAAKESERERKRAAKAAAAAAKPRRPRRKWGRSVAITLSVLAIAAVGVLHVMPMSTADYERAASEALGRPVKIGSARLSFLTGLELDLRGIAVDGVRIASARAYPHLGSMFDEKKSFSRIELEGVTLRQEAIGEALFGQARSRLFAVDRLVAKNVKLVGPLPLPTLDADLTLDSQGGLRAGQLSGPENLAVKLALAGSQIEFESSAVSFPLPMLPRLSLSQFAMKGTADRRGMEISSWSASLLDGVLRGSAKLRWGERWDMEGMLTARGVNAAVLAPALLSEGKADGTGRFSFGGDPAKLASSVRVEGQFVVNKGVLGSFDLSRAIQTSGRQPQGRTPFAELTGQGVYDKGAVTLRQVAIGAGALNAGASADISAEGALSGRIVADVKTANQTLRTTLNVVGNVKEPQVRN